MVVLYPLDGLNINCVMRNANTPDIWVDALRNVAITPGVKRKILKDNAIRVIVL